MVGMIFFISTRKEKSLNKTDINTINQLFAKNYNISQIQKETGFARKTIRKYINS